ncbi:MAG TPA: GGDEF domain-containing protein [Kofleriaceae bacterium]
MRDPRLVEIDFLMDLEREEILTIEGADYREVVNAAHIFKDPEGKRRLYGTDANRLADMVHGLLLKGLIDGFSSSDEYSSRVGGFHIDMKIRVRMTHAGRVHLWNLRDALLRDPDLEPMGLRSRAAWDRDLFVKLRWATPEAPLSMIFVDLDNFGAVNKEHGHPIGDAVLRAAFQLMRSTVGVRGDVYRYGGEEVGVLLPGIRLDEAKAIAEEIRALIEREVHEQVKQLGAPQTASIGVTSFDHVVENDAALDEVDRLMRAAKRAGKNRVECAA